MGNKLERLQATSPHLNTLIECEAVGGFCDGLTFHLRDFHETCWLIWGETPIPGIIQHFADTIEHPGWHKYYFEYMRDTTFIFNIKKPEDHDGDRVSVGPTKTLRN